MAKWQDEGFSSPYAYRNAQAIERGYPGGYPEERAARARGDLDPRTIVACRTDAIYATADPGWPDDGTDGRFRLTGAWPAMSAPTNHTELLRITGGD